MSTEPVPTILWSIMGALIVYCLCDAFFKINMAVRVLMYVGSADEDNLYELV